MNMSRTILEEDVAYIFEHLPQKDLLKGATIVVTGCAGFIGYTLMHFFSQYAKELSLESVIGLDNFIMGKPQWLGRLEPVVSICDFDVVTDDINNVKGAEKADYVIHLASIASPVYYRQHPVQTLDANVTGLRKLLDFYRNKILKGFLFMSSSEIYGNPEDKWIPTPESYHGDVACVGPRACYDESKRFGETLCYVFARQYAMPLTIVRPFNNYGPGMRIQDGRVTADIVKAILGSQDITLLSDGTPRRTFCYIADAVCGYLKALLYGKFDCFNIGADQPEITMRQLADLYAQCAKEHFGYAGDVVYAQSEDEDYLTDNPQRRCPDLNKSRDVLGFEPAITMQEGIYRYLVYLKENGPKRIRLVGDGHVFGFD